MGTWLTRARTASLAGHHRFGAWALALVAAFIAPTELKAQTTFSDDETARIAALGPWPQSVPADPGNALSGQPWAEALGAQLFRDTRLSGSGQIACISCHSPIQGFSEPRRVALGAKQHVRNTQGLWDIGLQRWFGWDGGADSLWAATLRPMLSELEMAGSIDHIANRFRGEQHVIDAIRSHGQDPAALSDTEFTVFLSKSIAAYLRTLTSPQTPFDQFRTDLLSGNLAGQARYPEAAKRGLKRFIGEANCVVCHVGPKFSNGEFHDIGRPFFTGVGQVDGGRYAGIQRLRQDPFNLLGQHTDNPSDSDARKTRTVTLGQSNFGQWRTPSLRNLSLTAPYMHDGSIDTLRGVVDHYADIDPTRLHTKGEAILKPMTLSDVERNDLVQFLKTLSVAERD